MNDKAIEEQRKYRIRIDGSLDRALKELEGAKDCLWEWKSHENSLMSHEIDEYVSCLVFDWDKLAGLFDKDMLEK